MGKTASGLLKHGLMLPPSSLSQTGCRAALTEIKTGNDGGRDKLPLCGPVFRKQHNLTRVLTFIYLAPFMECPDMLVCSCNFITDHEIRHVITQMLDEDCWQLIVPLKVYRAMEKRGRCCGCFPGVVDIIVETTESYHRAKQSPEDQVVTYLERIRNFREEARRLDHERRHSGHRAA